MKWTHTLRRWYGLFGHKLNRSKQTLENTTLRSKLASTPPIVLYQMGKVGSSSIYWPLKKVYHGAVIHAHNIRPDHYAAEVRILRSFMDKNKHAPIRVISLVREPISRNISGFFQDFERLVGVRAEDYTGSTQDLQAIFLEKYNHDIPHLWFDRRLKRDFNIDVFNVDFSDKGYHEYTWNHYSALVIKQSLADTVKEHIVQEFTSCPDFKMDMLKNRASDKVYAQLYQEFKTLSLPADYVSTQLNTKYSRHFYDKKNRMSIAALWTSDSVELI